MILVVNAGSTSLKAELFAPDLTSVLSLEIGGIGGAATLTVGDATTGADVPDPPAAVALLLRTLEARGHPPASLSTAAHRVVHGGALTAPARIDAAILAAIEAAIPLAPLHNPANLAPIRALAAAAPDLPQVASFDTAFHATCPEVATTYALPADLRAQGIRRYGFHGLSYASLVARLDPLPRRLLAFHLGGGASLCAILDGRSVATSMGYSPLDGLPMTTRVGEIDGMAVLRLAEEHGIAGAGRLLNRESGLKALAGTSDMRAILDRDDSEARFAVEHYCYWAIRHAGSAVAAMGGLDAMVFAGGIGENAGPIRDRIVAGLAFLGPVPVHVLPAEEERQIARDALEVLGR